MESVERVWSSSVEPRGRGRGRDGDGHRDRERGIKAAECANGRAYRREVMQS